MTKNQLIIIFHIVMNYKHTIKTSTKYYQIPDWAKTINRLRSMGGAHLPSKLWTAGKNTP